MQQDTSMSQMSQNSTGASNPQFNLVSVLYHALEGAQTYQKYIQDCQGDDELRSFFEQVQSQERQRAEQAKQLLSSRLSGMDFGSVSSSLGSEATGLSGMNNASGSSLDANLQ